jgi:hypothetical protein
MQEVDVGRDIGARIGFDVRGGFQDFHVGVVNIRFCPKSKKSSSVQVG